MLQEPSRLTMVTWPNDESYANDSTVEVFVGILRQFIPSPRCLLTTTHLARFAVVKISIFDSWMLCLPESTLLVRQWEEHPSCKSWGMRCWRGYLSGARCRWLAYDAIAILSSLASVKSRMVYLFAAGLPKLCWKKGCLMSVVVCLSELIPSQRSEIVADCTPSKH